MTLSLHPSSNVINIDFLGGVNLADNHLLHINRLAAKKDEKWLRKNIAIFSNNFMGSLYAKIKPQ